MSAEEAVALSPPLKRLDAWARELGFPTAAAAKKWLQRHGLVIYSPPGQVDFIDPAEVARYILTARAAPKPPPRRPQRRTDDEELDDAFAAKR